MKLQYFGHVTRRSAGNFSLTVLEGSVDGLCHHGRPKIQWMDDIEEWSGCSYIQLKKMSQDRELWRRKTIESSSAVANCHRRWSTSEWVSIICYKYLPFHFCLFTKGYLGNLANASVITKKKIHCSQPTAYVHRWQLLILLGWTGLIFNFHKQRISGETEFFITVHKTFSWESCGERILYKKKLVHRLTDTRASLVEGSWACVTGTTLDKINVTTLHVLHAYRIAIKRFTESHTPHTLCDKTFKLFRQNELVPVVHATWNNPEQIFGSDDGRSIAAPCAADSCEKDRPSGLYKSSIRTAISVSSITWLVKRRSNNYTHTCIQVIIHYITLH